MYIAKEIESPALQMAQVKFGSDAVNVFVRLATRAAKLGGWIPNDEDERYLLSHVTGVTVPVTNEIVTFLLEKKLLVLEEQGITTLGVRTGTEKFRKERAKANERQANYRAKLKHSDGVVTGTERSVMVSDPQKDMKGKDMKGYETSPKSPSYRGNGKSFDPVKFKEQDTGEDYEFE